MPTNSLLHRSLLLSVLLAGCEHSTPFHPGDYGSKGPLRLGSPTRLTFNPGQDLIPFWTSADSIVYTAERIDRADKDRCLAFLPGGGGAVSRYACGTITPDDSLNVFEDGAVRGDNQIAYVRSSTTRLLNRLSPDVQQLVIAPAREPRNVNVLASFPLITPWGTAYDGVAHLTWRSATELLLVGQRISYPRPCRFCAPDTVRTGIEIAAIDVAGGTPGISLVPGTADASSLSLGATSDTIYFTRVGDSLVYRLAFSSGLTDTVYNFGAAGIARDVSVGGGRLTAVVGGSVTDAMDPFLGRFQLDHGGLLYAVVLPFGAATQLGDTAWRFRRPALSSDGSRIVVSVLSGASAPSADLWLFQLP